MAYNNNYGNRGFYGGGRSNWNNNQGGGRSNWNNNGGGRYGGGGYGNQQPARKRTGAKFHSNAKNDKPCITAWRATKAGIMSLVACPTKKGMVSEQSEQWVGTVTVPNQKPFTVTCFFNINTKKLTIPDLSLVANPNISGGGFFGSFFKRKQR